VPTVSRASTGLRQHSHRCADVPSPARREPAARDTPIVIAAPSGTGEGVEGFRDWARRRRLRTVGLVSYDGGRIVAETLADGVVVSRSEHIPTIQEAQAAAYHVLRELVE
jgi:hypothetical protein